MAKWDKIKLKDLLSNDDSDEHAKKIGLEVAMRLRAKLHLFDDDSYDRDEVAEAIDIFEDCEGVDDFNDALGQVYDAADRSRIWID